MDLNCIMLIEVCGTNLRIIESMLYGCTSDSIAYIYDLWCVNLSSYKYFKVISVIHDEQQHIQVKPKATLSCFSEEKKYENNQNI